MSRVPLANATVISIAGGGFTEDHGAAPSDDTPRWEGHERAHLREELRTITRRGQQDQIDATVLSIPLRLTRQLKRGDTLTYIPDGDDQATREVRDLELFRTTGIAHLLFWED